jgi:hypothetical protein
MQFLKKLASKKGFARKFWEYKNSQKRVALGCALVFASDARKKIEIEAKISFRLEKKKGMISVVSHRSEIAKSETKKNRKVA